MKVRYPNSVQKLWQCECWIELNILFRKPSEQHPAGLNVMRFGPIYWLYAHQCHLIRWPIESNNEWIGHQFFVNSELQLNPTDLPSIRIPTLHHFSFVYYVWKQYSCSNYTSQLSTFLKCVFWSPNQNLNSFYTEKHSFVLHRMIDAC